MEDLNKNETLAYFPSRKGRNRKMILLGLTAVVMGVFFGLYLLSAPANFPQDEIINIKAGAGLRQASLKLKEAGIIRSRTLFETFTIMYGGDRSIIASDYYFKDKIPVYEVARRLSSGDHKLVAFKATIPEGFNRQEIADVLVAKLPYFDKDNFLSLSKDKEGYLFPDTYFFFPSYTEVDVIKIMESNYETKVSPLRAEMITIQKSEKDIINMAALIEKEAKGDLDREIVSGILWKRFSIGMALQADAAPETYERKGLPDAPLGSPGLKAIKAAMYPTTSPYLYYIHDKQGRTHYARTFAEHRSNIERYLK